MKNKWTFLYKFFLLYYVSMIFLGERFNLSDYRGLVEFVVQILVVTLLFMEEKKNNEDVHPE